MSDDPTQDCECSPVSEKLKKVIQDALEAEYTGIGMIHIATTHAKFDSVDRINVIASNEFNPVRPNK
jgi:hypothetical protein